ncbi:MAG: ribosome maturation factor RimM [Desulfobulbaceae bacterium]|nr:ribosome maturation factor RimM [Desulfobulbaceae bacterium]
MSKSCSPEGCSEVAIGKITKPHGIKGELKVFPYSGSAENFAFYTRFFLFCSGEENGRWFDIHKVRSQGRFAVVSLEGVKDRNASESLTGCEVWVARHEMPELPEDEFYWQDLLGLDVLTVDGEQLGKVSDLLSTGAHDILVVKGAGREYMIPALDEFVVEIDEESGTIQVDLPDGLLEMNS